MAIHNQNKHHATTVEREVMNQLRAWYFNRVSLEMICQSKSRKQKCRVSHSKGGSGNISDGDQECDEPLLRPMWNAGDINDGGSMQSTTEEEESE
jgi:hypothetical protein